MSIIDAGSGRTRPTAAPIAVRLAGAFAIVLAIPLIWRAVVLAWGPPAGAIGNYLPALDPDRSREAPFDRSPLEGLHRVNPGFVILGDSMAGRIDIMRLDELSGQAVAPLIANASGSARWYLAFKNDVVREGLHPKWAVVFFRDTNLTDPLFRLSFELLDPVALDREDELNAVIASRRNGAWILSRSDADRWFGAEALVDRAYGADRARRWLEPRIASDVAAIVAGNARRKPFLDTVNAMFALEHLRPLAAADIAAPNDRAVDFASNVNASVLPLLLRLGRENGTRLCFVRVLRRPVEGRPPPQSAALVRYMRDVREYLDARGAVLIDDYDDPEMARLAYNDGDHIAGFERRRYTELFHAKLLKHSR